jgi:hypothetical protein
MTEKIIFDATKFDRAGDGENYGYFTDGSDAYANRGMVIGFHHIPSGKELYFKAAITAFNESYSSDWTSEAVYGRADPIRMFKQTERSISMAFRIAASSKGEAFENLAKVGDLVKFLYPYYSDVADATTIGQSPLVRIKLMNLLSNAQGTRVKYVDLSTSGNSSAAAGLLGAITNIAVNHNLENNESGVIEIAANDHPAIILPRLIEINMDFSPIHETPLGWGPSDETSFGDADAAFPYGLDLEGSEANSSETLKDIQAENAKAFDRAIESVKIQDTSDTDDGADAGEEPDPEAVAASDAAESNSLAGAAATGFSGISIEGGQSDEQLRALQNALAESAAPSWDTK